MAPRKNAKAAATVRLVDFTSDIYIGESIQPNFGIDSAIEIILPSGEKEWGSHPYEPISTNPWKPGMATVIIKENEQHRVQHFNIINPVEIANQYNQLTGILKEIDLVIEARLSNGGVLQTSINNKSLTNESLSALYAIRSAYVKRINNELAKINKTQQNNPIKSITRFTRGKY